MVGLVVCCRYSSLLLLLLDVPLYLALVVDRQLPLNLLIPPRK
jgi:hypothetical protein